MGHSAPLVSWRTLDAVLLSFFLAIALGSLMVALYVRFVNPDPAPVGIAVMALLLEVSAARLMINHQLSWFVWCPLLTVLSLLLVYMLFIGGGGGPHLSALLQSSVVVTLVAAAFLSLLSRAGFNVEEQLSKMQRPRRRIAVSQKKMSKGQE